MSTDVSQIHLGDIAVDVVLKDIRHVHLSVHPPTGRVRISAPKRMRLDTIRVFAISKLAWIRQQQMRIMTQSKHQRRPKALHRKQQQLASLLPQTRATAVRLQAQLVQPREPKFEHQNRVRDR